MSGSRMAVHPGDGGIILGAELHPGDVAKEDARARRVLLDDDVAELIGRLQPRLRGHDCVEHLRVGLRDSADLARRDLGILRLDRGGDVARLR